MLFKALKTGFVENKGQSGPLSVVTKTEGKCQVSHRQKFRTKIFVPIIWTCFFNDLSRCQIRASTGSLSRYPWPYLQSKRNRWTKILSIILKCVQLSLEREVLHEIWTNFPGDIEKRLSKNFAVESILKFTVFSKLKKRKKFLSGSTKCNWNWK